MSKSVKSSLKQKSFRGARPRNVEREWSRGVRESRVGEWFTKIFTLSLPKSVQILTNFTGFPHFLGLKSVFSRKNAKTQLPYFSKSPPLPYPIRKNTWHFFTLFQSVKICKALLYPKIGAHRPLPRRAVDTFLHVKQM